MSRSQLPVRVRKPLLDVPQLRVHCAQRVAAGEAVQTVDMLLDIVEALTDRLTRVEQRLDLLLAERYSRKSERLSSAQLQLALGSIQPPFLLAESDSQDNLPSVPDATAQPSVQPVRRRRVRKLRSGHLPAHLPRTHLVSEPSAQELCCVKCGEQKKPMGTEHSEVLEWEPGGFRVEVTERRKYACKSCESGVVIGPAPVRVIDGAMPGPGLLSEVLVCKGSDHIPMERQSRIFRHRYGVPISASTLGAWFAQSLDLLAPLGERLGQLCLSRMRLSVDDTGLQVLDRSDSRGIKRGHLWPFRSDSEVYFVYTPSWEGKPIQELLKDFHGTLQTDGFSGLDPLYRKPGAPIRAGCLAHLRRKFLQAFELGDARAAGPLSVIQKIYKIERQMSEKGLDAEARQRRREECSRPLMTALRTQVDQLSYESPPKTPMGRAITYALRQWDTLTVFLRDGALRPDNNAVENSLRPIAIGRKNWLFAGSDEGAKRLATLYTLLGSCQLAEIADPWAYLRDVLSKLSHSWPHSRLDELLPQQWKQSQVPA